MKHKNIVIGNNRNKTRPNFLIKNNKARCTGFSYKALNESV